MDMILGIKSFVEIPPIVFGHEGCPDESWQFGVAGDDLCQ